MNLTKGDFYEIGVGLGGTLTLVSIAPVTGIERHQASMLMIGTDPVRVSPDEMVSAAALERGAEEVAHNLAISLIDAASPKW
jgi:hypothetical protein